MSKLVKISVQLFAIGSLIFSAANAQQNYSSIRAKKNPAAWKWKYFNELSTPGFEVLVNESSIDRRLANIQYVVNDARSGDVDIYKYSSGNPQLDEHHMHQVAGSAVDEKLCSWHLEQMLHQIDDLAQRARQSQPVNETHIRLARILDSFGRYEGGYLSGRHISPGSYSQCIDTHFRFADKNVASRYCMARLKLDRNLHPELKAHRMFADPTLATGICIPETCHSKSFAKNKQVLQKVVNSQFRLPESIYSNPKLELDSIYCLKDADAAYGIPLGGKVFLVVLGMILVTSLLTSLYQHEVDKIKSPKLSLIFKCFNLGRSLRDYTIVRKIDTQAKVQTDIFDGIRAIICFGVVLNHQLPKLSLSSVDLIKLNHEIENDGFSLSLISLATFIETLQLVAALLLTYTTLRGYKKLSNNVLIDFAKQCYKLFVRRCTRLIPFFFVYYCFKRLVLIYSGTGPLWDDGFNSNTTYGVCKQESWLNSLLITTEPALSKRCMVQTWTVSNDILYLVVLIPIIFTLRLKPRLALFGIVTLMVASIHQHYQSLQYIDSHMIKELSQFRLHAITYLARVDSSSYVGPFNKLSYTLFGVLAGYIIYLYERDKIKEWPKWFKGPLTITSSLFLIVYVNLPFIPDALFDGDKQSVEPSHMMVTIKILWTAASTIIIMRLITDWKDKVWITWLRGRFWTLLVKLSYAILLIHLDLINKELQTGLSVKYFTKAQIFVGFAWACGCSLVLGFFAHVLIEYPLLLLFQETIISSKEKLVVNGYDQKSQAPKEAKKVE